MLERSLMASAVLEIPETVWSLRKPFCINTRYMEPQSVLIAGSGRVGFRTALAFLDRKNWEVRVLVRELNPQDPSKLKTLSDLQAKGAKLVVGDFSDINSLVKATQGVDVVISTLNSDGLSLQSNLLQASKQSGVKRFVPSEFGADITKSKTPIFQSKIPLRNEIESSGLEWTYVNVGFWYETTFRSIDVKNKKITIIGDGNALNTYTSIDDMCDVLPEIVGHPASKNASISLVGENLTWNQIAEIFENQFEIKFERSPLPTETIEQQIASLKNPFENPALHVKLIIAKGWSLLDNGPQQQIFTTKKFKSVKEWLAENAKSFQ